MIVPLPTPHAVGYPTSSQVLPSWRVIVAPEPSAPVQKASSSISSEVLSSTSLHVWTLPSLYSHAGPVPPKGAPQEDTKHVVSASVRMAASRAGVLDRMGTPVMKINVMAH